MSGGLQIAGDEGPRCALCGGPAAGPCMSCRAMICGDCCVLTEGGSRPYAICLRCDRRKGRSLAPAWRGFLLFLGGILLALAAAVALLSQVAGR